MRDLIIELFESGDAQQAAHVVGKTMCTNPTHVAVFQGKGEEETRREEAMFEIWFKYNPGHTYVARFRGRLVAVLRTVPWPCWFRQLPEEAEKLALLTNQALKDSGPRVREWLSVWMRHDPDEPHWHVGPFAVSPEMQGQGIGSQMFKRFCEHVDSRWEAIYLETDKPENVRFYERFGFSVTGKDEVFGTHSYFLWRPPRII